MPQFAHLLKREVIFPMEVPLQFWYNASSEDSYWDPRHYHHPPKTKGVWGLMCISRSKAKPKKSLPRNKFLILSVKSKKKNFLPFQGKGRHIIITTADHGINESDSTTEHTDKCWANARIKWKSTCQQKVGIMSGWAREGGARGLHGKASNSLPSI